MSMHELKTWEIYFNEILLGRKKFEVRENDRGFSVGDILHLRSYHPDLFDYTGESLKVVVNYMLRGGTWGLEDGYVIMGFDSIFDVKTGEPDDQ